MGAWAWWMHYAMSAGDDRHYNNGAHTHIVELIVSRETANIYLFYLSQLYYDTSMG